MSYKLGGTPFLFLLFFCFLNFWDPVINWRSTQNSFYSSFIFFNFVAAIVNSTTALGMGREKKNSMWLSGLPEFLDLLQVQSCWTMSLISVPNKTNQRCTCMFRQTMKMLSTSIRNLDLISQTPSKTTTLTLPRQTVMSLRSSSLNHNQRTNIPEQWSTWRSLFIVLLFEFYLTPIILLRLYECYSL